MVTERAYSYYLARKKHKEEGDFSILNEIAKMKGFKGGKIGEKRIDPIEQYVEYLAREMGFRGMKKGDIVDGEKISVDISSYEQFRARLRKDIQKEKEELMKKAQILRAEGKIEEAIRKEEEASEVEMPKDMYMYMVPKEEYDKALDALRQKWITEHQKFLAFCDELEKDVRSWFEKTKKKEAALSVEDAMKSLDEYHITHHDSMNIYTRDDFLIGLKYCFPEKGIGVTTKKMKIKPEEPYKTYIIFEQL